jgi:multidrug efflux pump subunit AcrA (membrane-fusion protein)
MEHEYVVNIRRPGQDEIQRTYRSDLEVQERQILNLEGLQVVVTGIIEPPRIGRAGIIEAESFPRQVHKT